MATGLEKDVRRELLESLSLMPREASEVKNNIEKFFLPIPLHARALESNSIIVRGERGAGKTALFHFLTDHGSNNTLLRRLFPRTSLQSSIWIEGFSEGAKHPSTVALDQFGNEAQDVEIRLMWVIHLVGRLCEDMENIPECPSEVYEVWVEHRNNPKKWVEIAQERHASILNWLDKTDNLLAEQDKEVLVTYDELDRIAVHASGNLRERFAGTLLSLWQSFAKRYRALSAKIFLRNDIFESSRTSYPDSSKLESRSVALHWDRQSLYRLLLRHMAAHDNLREWLGKGRWGIEFEFDETLGWLPPVELPESGQISIRGFIRHLAGELMGRGVKKGYTHRWIINHLQDAHTRVVPRSLLNLVGLAAERAISNGPKAVGARLLHPEELRQALDETSRRRVAELREEHKVVARLANLKGLVLMLERKEVIEKLSNATAEEDGFGDDGSRVLEELIRLGVIRSRSDTRLDVPDLYRYGFGIKRKGGVRRPA